MCSPDPTGEIANILVGAGLGGFFGGTLGQRISRGRVDLGESLLSGAGNALSEALYDTGPVNSVKDAFIRGAATYSEIKSIIDISKLR